MGQGLCLNLIGIHEDIKVEIIGHCDPNDQEARFDSWIFHFLCKRFKSKARIKILNKLIQCLNEHFLIC